MFITDFSVRKPVTALMLVLIIVVLGVVSFSKLPIDLLPDLEFPLVSIITEYGGIGPEEMELSVTRLVESSANRVDGVKNIYSVSQRGVSVVRVEFDWGTDMNLACQEIREKLDELGTGYFGLPEDSKRPIIAKYNMADMPLMFMSLSGKGIDVHQLKETAEDYMQNQLEAVEGVAWVAIFAGAPREVLVSLDRDLLSAYGISITQVIQKLSSENIDATSGNLKEGYKDYLIRVKGKFKRVLDIKDMVLTVRDGVPIHLGDVGRVYDTYGEQLVYSRTNLLPSIGIMVMKQAGTNTVRVCNRARKKLREIEEYLPEGMTVRIGFDQAEYIEKSIGNLGSNALWGGILAVFILWFFLRHIRPLVIISLAIPISLLGACIPIYFSHMTLNMMSLGGIALAIGMLLDNSIVVLENAFRRMQEEKESRIEAARKGASEVAGPIVASTFTTIGVFIPIAFTTGIAARIFRELALTVSYSLLASLFLALTMVPMMVSKILRVNLYKKEERSFLGIRDKYEKLLPWVLARPWKTVVIALVLFCLSLLLIFPIGKEFMPTANDRMFMAGICLPQGTRLEETNKVAGEVEKILVSLPELETEQVMVGIAQGGSGSETLASNEMMVIVRLVEAEKRKRTTPEVIEEVRERISVFPQIEKSNFTNLQTMSVGGGEGKPVDIKIFGKDLPTLAGLSGEVKKRIEKIDGLRDVEETFAYGNPELQIEFDREKCAQYGLTVRDVVSVLDAAIAGKIATRFEDMGEEIDVRVRLMEKDRVSLYDIKRIFLLSPGGVKVRLGDIAKINKAAGPNKIVRENQKRKVAILANISQKKDLGHIMAEVKKRLAGLALPTGYFIEYGGSYKDMMESFMSLGIAFLLAILLIYMIMAAQFESLLHPFVIMFSIPFALVGVLWALFLSGMNLSVNAFIGVIMLSGIVVNNGIVLVDYINRLRREGMEKKEAIPRACHIRFRPILMTALTTILGVAPMVFIGGSGAEMRRPLAIAVMGGLLVGTIVTLVIMPAVYSILDRKK